MVDCLQNTETDLLFLHILCLGSEMMTAQHLRLSSGLVSVKTKQYLATLGVFLITHKNTFL